MNEIKKLDTKMRKLPTIQRMHHAKVNVDRLCLPRTSWGRGPTKIETAYKPTTVGLETYLRDSEDNLL